MEVIRSCLCWLLRWTGPIPRHVAFIMDGNRRFASKQHIDKKSGHSSGYSKMLEAIPWCVGLGVQVITVFAFSVDNFNRSEKEVSDLMSLAEEKYKELCQDNSTAARYKVQVQVLGDLTLAPDAVQKAAEELVRSSKERSDNRAVLNICFGYTSSQELLRAMNAVMSESTGAGCTAAWDGVVRKLYTGDAPPVDMMIRTSGETRLSDFMLWQCSTAALMFLEKLWPDISFWDFLMCVVQYQLSHDTLQSIRQSVSNVLHAKELYMAG